MAIRLKILQGKYRGRSVDLPPDVKGSRNATPSLVKEAAFQLLDNRVGDPARYAFLDLCAGSGQMGLEALSRGYREIHLAELERARFSFLLKNCAPYRGEIKLHNKDFRRMSSVIFAAGDCVVFLDPPYSFWKGAECEPMDRFLENLSTRQPDDQTAPANNADIIILLQGPAAYGAAEKYCASPLELTEVGAHTYRKQVLTLLRLRTGNSPEHVKSAEP